MKPVDIYNELLNEKFIVCSRSNGMIAPLSMKMRNGLSELLSGTNLVYRHRGKHHLHFYTGVYRLMPSGEFKCVNQKLRKLIDSGIPEVESLLP